MAASLPLEPKCEPTIIYQARPFPVAEVSTYGTFETQEMHDDAAAVVSGRDVERLALIVAEARSVPVERIPEFVTSSVV